ncbi:MAG: hypothetical protein AAF988_01795 [Pseudomonadota bacterium]
MTQQSAFLIKTLEKIGAPLAAAVEEVSARLRHDMEAPAREVEDAKVMAQLLGQTVQVSLSLGSALVKASDEAQADALRLAVASMIAPLIAGYFRQHGQVPDDQALSRMTKSLEASVAFAENFNPDYAQGSRLSQLGEDALVFDDAQKNINALDVLVPVMKAIGEFPFGQSETKLLQDVSGKLKEKAASLNEGGDTLSEMAILKSLAKIYADCHLAEVKILSQSDNEERTELSTDPIWKAFDTRLAMVSTLLGMAPVNETVSSAGTAAPAASSAPSEAQQVAQQPAQPAAPVEQAPVAPPQAPVAPPAQETPAAAPVAAAAPAAGGNPMSFFGAKPDQAAAPTATPAPETPAQPAAPQAAPPQQPATDAVPAQPPATAAPAEAPAGQSGNPMSFFKGGNKETDDSGQGA